MATFQQSKASSDTLWLGVKAWLVDYFNVTEKTVERWRNFVQQNGHQSRNPAGAFQNLPTFLSVTMYGDYMPQADPKYLKEDYHIYADYSGQQDVEGFIRDVMLSGSEGFQNIFDYNSYGDGMVDNVYDLEVG